MEKTKKGSVKLIERPLHCNSCITYVTLVSPT